MASEQPRRTSAGRRYLPVLAVIVVIGIVVALVAVFTSGGDDSDDTATTDTGASAESSVPISFDEAKAAGTLDDYDFGDNCNTETGRVAFPSVQAPQCVPVWDGTDNGGATHQGITADTIKIGLYSAEQDPQMNALLQAVGAYDPPDKINATRKSYLEMFSSLMETYGRKLEFVVVKGTGPGTDSVAARADAIKAAEEQKVFAVLGGPVQTKAFAEELAKRGVLCIGTCLLSQPEGFYAKYSDYVYGNGPSPEQTYRHTTEFISKQLEGKKATFAGDPELLAKDRKFALIAYDTPDGDFTVARKHFEEELAAEGIDLAETVTYFLDLAKAQEDARTIITKLKSSGATSVIFTGDPLMPKYFSEEATRQGYFPEWILSGTVLADTTTLGRIPDPKQWAHAVAYTYLSARIPQEDRDAWVSHNWWYGTKPPSDNSYEISFADTLLLAAGIQAAGPDLTPQTFHAGIYKNSPAVKQAPDILTPVLDFDDEGGLWDQPDNNGVDNAALLWWDPSVSGPDETGTVAPGMWRYVNEGRRFLPGGWPTDPIPLFDPKGTVTVYDKAPDGLKPPDYPTNPASVVAKGTTTTTGG